MIDHNTKTLNDEMKQDNFSSPPNNHMSIIDNSGPLTSPTALTASPLHLTASPSIDSDNESISTTPNRGLGAIDSLSNESIANPNAITRGEITNQTESSSSSQYNNSNPVNTNDNFDAGLSIIYLNNNRYPATSVPTIGNTSIYPSNINSQPSSPTSSSSPTPSYTSISTQQHGGKSTAKINVSITGPLAIAIIQLFMGMALFFPFIAGFIIHNIAIIMYGGYGILLAFSSAIAIYGILHSKLIAIQLFKIWSILSILLSIAGTVTIGVLAKFGYIELLNSSWTTSIIVIAFIGVIAIGWAIFCIVWIGDIIKDLKSSSSLRLKDEETAQMKQIINDKVECEMLSQMTTRPRVGTIGPEDPISIAIKKFKVDPDDGIDYLLSNNLLPSSEYRNLISFLHQAEGLDKTQLGLYLSENSTEKKDILKKYTEYFYFEGQEFDDALRRFLAKFRLPREAQQIDRVMECFANKYHLDNPDKFSDSDTAYLLAFSIILLNTDAHNPNIVHKMSKSKFVKNCDFTKGKMVLATKYLEALYDRITNNEIKMEKDIFSNSIHEGWLYKLSTNKRSYQKRWFIVKNNCLYYFKNNNDDEHPKSIIPLEGLQVIKRSKDSFDIEDSAMMTIKSVKLTHDGPQEGHRKVFRFKTESPLDTTKWIDALKANTLSSPILLLIKKKKKLLRLGSGSQQQQGGDFSDRATAQSVSSYDMFGNGSPSSGSPLGRSLQTNNMMSHEPYLDHMGDLPRMERNDNFLNTPSSSSFLISRIDE